MISMIAAESENHVIGMDNKLVWNIPADTAFFKATTLHHTIIMGRKTFDSIVKPLPKRRNLVVSRDPDLKIPGAEVFSNLPDALKVCEMEEECFIVGGSTLYKEGLNYAHRIYLTKIHTQVEGDSYFPVLDSKIWKLVKQEDHKADEKNPLDYSFMIFER